MQVMKRLTCHQGSTPGVREKTEQLYVLDRLYRGVWMATCAATTA